jgi:hypothetical protein
VIADSLFVLAQASLCLFGVAAAFHPSVRAFSAPARLGVALAAGAVALTIEATLFSAFGVRWSVVALAAPLLVGSGLLAVSWGRRAASLDEPPSHLRTGETRAMVLALLAFAFLAFSFASSASTSVDYLLFWGVKAVRYAEARGIDAAFLRNPYSDHTVPHYPPLVPIVQGWGVLAAGKMPWRLEPLLSAVWPVATAAVLFDLLRRRLAYGAASVTTFWSVALSFSLAYSYSGGNAEAPLLFFETIALACLLTESREGVQSRFLPGLALCGATLTKVEGAGAALLLVVGVLLRDRILGRPRALADALRLLAGPALGLAVWFGYQRSVGLPVGYQPHGQLLRLYPEHTRLIVQEMLHSLNAGTVWISWIVPLLFLVAFAKRWKTFLPALTLAVGLLCFLIFDYLHDPEDPTVRISWTLPRVCQPALSALILGAGVASFRNGERGDARRDPTS